VAGSILTTVKKALGVVEDDTTFDADILLYTNSVLATLNQIGVGPIDGFQIEDASATWDDFLGDDLRLNGVPSFVYLRVRLLFDPPLTSFAIEAMERQAKEYETRVYLLVEADKAQ
jgi:hypothetical protein